MNYLASFINQQDHLSDLYNQFNKDYIFLLYVKKHYINFVLEN
jgi:hypothetical protein